MTTPGAWLTLLAVLVAGVGLLLSFRQLQTRRRLIALIATFAATVVTGWLAWYSTIQV